MLTSEGKSGLIGALEVIFGKWLYGASLPPLVPSTENSARAGQGSGLQVSGDRRCLTKPEALSWMFAVTLGSRSRSWRSSAC